MLRLAARRSLSRDAHRTHTCVRSLTIASRLLAKPLTPGASATLAGQPAARKLQPVLPKEPPPPPATDKDAPLHETFRPRTVARPAPAQPPPPPAAKSASTSGSASAPHVAQPTPAPQQPKPFFAPEMARGVPTGATKAAAPVSGAGGVPKTPAPALGVKPAAMPTAPVAPPKVPVSAGAPPSGGSGSGRSGSTGSSVPPPPLPPPPPPRSWMGRALRWGAVFVVGSGVMLVAIQASEDVHLMDMRNMSARDFVRRCQTFGNAIVRLWRDLYCATRILCDYEWSLRNLEGAELDEKRKAVHLRSALRLRELMRANGGIYIKFGQHIAQLRFLLPDEYVDTMAPMLNQAPTSSIAEVRRVFREEFGRELEEVFSEFDERPVASASLAQVHFATLREGVRFEGAAQEEQLTRRVAVKVQHAALQANCESDIATVRFIIRLIHRIDARFNYQWLSDEMATNLPLECDFHHEAKNSERARNNLRCDQRDDVALPRIHWQYTSKRVLTMEKMDGCLINDVKALKEQGISVDAVSTVMAQVFSEMIFLHGFVHCDPHAGNMLIQPRSATDRRPRLILLDHGLYRAIDDDFRISYAHLWNALIRGDAPAIKKYAQEMNAGEMYPLFASMLTRKPYHEITAKRGDAQALMSKNDESERAQLQAWAIEYAEDVQAILARMSKPLLLLLKTNDCLRAVDTHLGTPINSFIIMGRYCQRAINEDRLRNSSSYRDRFEAWWDMTSMEIRLKFYQIMMGLLSWWHSLGQKVAPAAVVAV